MIINTIEFMIHKYYKLINLQINIMIFSNKLLYNQIMIILYLNKLIQKIIYILFNIIFSYLFYLCI